MFAAIPLPDVMVMLFSITLGAFCALVPLTVTLRNTSSRGIGLAPAAGACTSARYISGEVRVYEAAMGANEVTSAFTLNLLFPIAKVALGMLAVLPLKVMVALPPLIG